jgi:hypothetical protein
MGMDVTPIILGITAINLAVLFAGACLAAYRTWRESHPARHRTTAPVAQDARRRAEQAVQVVGGSNH